MLTLIKKFEDNLRNQFDLLNDAIPVGFIQIRKQVSRSDDVPEDFASHVYYEIIPEMRGRGYGIEILKLGLVEARKIELKELVLTCYEDNLASRSVIERNGGVFVKDCVLADGKKFLKFIISL